jgi:hypothetical protein
MVDGELWCRFFRHADLWHVDAVLAGYRHHGENRALRFQDECIAEMERAIQQLRSDVDPSVLRCARQLRRLSRVSNIVWAPARKFIARMAQTVVGKRCSRESRYCLLRFDLEKGAWSKSYRLRQM